MEGKTIEAQVPTPMTEGRENAHSQPTQFGTQIGEAWAKLRAQASEFDKAKAAEPVEPDRRFEKDRDTTKDPLPVSPKDKALGLDTKAEKKVEKVVAKEAVEPTATDEAPPESAKSEEAKSSWAKLKAARDEAAKKAEALEAEVLALKQQFDPDLFKKTKEENDQLTQALRRLNVEMHPKFRETFDAPIEQAVSRAKKFVPDQYHAEVDKVLKAPDSPERDQAIQAITENLPIHKQAAFIRHVEDASMAIEKKQNALRDEQKYVTEWESQEKAKQEAARVQADALARTTFQNVFKTKFAENPVFKGEEAETNLKAAQDLLFGNNSPEVLAEAVLYAQYGKQMAPLLQKAHDELKAAYSQIDRLTSKSGGKAVASGSDSAPKDMWSAIREAMAA
jgi:hypothetical protein